MATNPPTTRDKFDAAISQVFAADAPGTFVVEWVALVKVVRPDGHRVICDMHSEGLGLDEEIGMIEFHNRSLIVEPGRSYQGDDPTDNDD